MQQATLMLVRLPKVIEITGLRRSSIYARIKPGNPQYCPSFPKPVQLSDNGKGAVAWVLPEVEAWVQERIELSRK